MSLRWVGLRLWIVVTLGCILSQAVRATGQTALPTQFAIGEIDFFGAGSTDLPHLRSSLPMQEGDTYSEAQMETAFPSLKTKLTEALGHPPTDVDLVCCDAQQHWMIYVGLGADGTLPMRYDPPPVGRDRLPESIVALYRHEMDVLMEAVQRGQAGEDDSHGYTLSNDPPLRAIQLKMRAFAIEHGALIRRVAARASSKEQRVVAAQLLGYCLRTPEQMTALDNATRDANSDVRNNATRALFVLAGSSPEVASTIPPGGFIAMLNSGSWSDRNKGSLLLLNLTRSRDPKTLKALRCRALPSLIEMAHWRNTGHAGASLLMLGRIEGIPEQTLGKMVDSGDTAAIFAGAATLNRSGCK
jgi:hypothetical protein